MNIDKIKKIEKLAKIIGEISESESANILDEATKLLRSLPMDKNWNIVPFSDPTCIIKHPDFVSGQWNPQDLWLDKNGKWMITVNEYTGIHLPISEFICC